MAPPSMMLSSCLRLVAPALAALSFIACARSLSISQVLQQGDYADRKHVVLTGDVVGSPERGAQGWSSYDLEDGSGRISIQTRQDPPLPCHTVRVKGRVSSVFMQATNRARPGEVYARWWVGVVVTEAERQDLGLTLTANVVGCSGWVPPK
jgi:hypothetical protein